MVDVLKEATDSVTRIQEFDVGKLARTELGPFNFTDAAAAAARVKALFARLPITYFSEFPNGSLEQIRESANSVWDLFQSIAAFDPTSDQVSQPRPERDHLAQRVTEAYDQHFDRLRNHITYLASSERNFGAIEERARAAATAANDIAEQLKASLSNTEIEAKRILGEVRATAAELGVSQQAEHFKTEASDHASAAETWQRYTRNWAIGLGVYAVVSITLAKIPWLSPATPYEAVQLTVSKVLIFAVIAYMLLLSARTMLAHRHNAVVNKHRMNALLTFNALTDGTIGDAQRDAVVMAAAQCIYAPQETGYGKSGGTGAPQLIEILPRMMNPGASAPSAGA